MSTFLIRAENGAKESQASPSSIGIEAADDFGGLQGFFCPQIWKNFLTFPQQLHNPR